MSEEEKDILVTKRKYWTKVMKYNVKYTIVCVIYIIFCLVFVFPINIEEQATIDVFLVLAFYLSLLYIPSCWFLLFVMYGYHRMGIFKIPKFKVLAEKPEVLAKSSGISLRSTQKHNGAIDEDKIKRLKSIAELRDSGILTEDEFQEQKSKILSETPSQSNDSPFSLAAWINTNLSLGNAAVVGIVVGVIILISIISLLSFLGTSDGARVYIEGEYTYNYGLCWSGAFHNGDSIISISGCGNEEFYCQDGDFCSINAQKDEDNSYELCVKIYTYKDRETTEACTTAAYGIAQV